MSEEDHGLEDADMAEVIALIVHDLRNPIATISANISYIRMLAQLDDPDGQAALDDVQDALLGLTRGLEQVGWIGGWIGGLAPVGVSPGDAREAVREAVEQVGGGVEVELPNDAVHVQSAGAPLCKLVELFLRNAKRHGRARVALSPDGVIEIRDDGPAVGLDLRERVFSMAGQRELKTRRDGRYERVVGLLAARALADALGAQVEADGEDGAAVFRIRVRAT